MVKCRLTFKAAAINEGPSGTFRALGTSTDAITARRLLVTRRPAGSASTKVKDGCQEETYCRCPHEAEIVLAQYGSAASRTESIASDDICRAAISTKNLAT